MALDILPKDEFPLTVEEDVENVTANYEHGNYLTYISPEEFALLFAIVHNQLPQKAVFMGSSYCILGYGSKRCSSRMALTLIDVDPVVMRLAEHNFEDAHLVDNTEFLVGDAEMLVKEIQVLDAEGPKSEDMPDDSCDKAIYYRQLKAAIGWCLTNW
ncbi:hypothetical protein V2G26_010794 [Clonostachys chloroleuca]|jgi:predicted O-methyltransferase YrrM